MARPRRLDVPGNRAARVVQRRKYSAGDRSCAESRLRAAAALLAASACFASYAWGLVRFFREPGGAAPDLREIDYHLLIANAADFMADRLDADLLFVPMERGDIRHSHAVIAQMALAERAFVLRGEYGPREVLGLMSHLDMVVGMRLHFLIFAALQGVPFVALPYASKVTGFIEDLEMPAPPLKLVNAGRLIAYLDDCWDNRRNIRERIAKRLPDLKERAREAFVVTATPAEGEPAKLYFDVASGLLIRQVVTRHGEDVAVHHDQVAEFADLE